MAPAYELQLRLSVTAGEAMPAETRAAWMGVTGKPLVDGLGSTEMLHVFCSQSPDEPYRGAIGRALPGYELRVVDQNMVNMEVGQIGWLAVRGPTGCSYLRDERQVRCVRNGWTLTGDTGHLDAEGYFYYNARSDDIIVSAGYNISGLEVESVLLRHESVLDCAVIGYPDAMRGQVIKAFVVVKDGVDSSFALAEELQQFVKQKIAPYKYPRLIEFRQTLPRTETGKVQRYKLRRESMTSPGGVVTHNLLTRVDGGSASQLRLHPAVAGEVTPTGALMLKGKAKEHPFDFPGSQLSAHIGIWAPGIHAWSSRPHEVLIYVLRGRGKSRVGQSEVQWRGGDALYVPADVDCEHFNTFDDEDVLYISFDAKLLQNKYDCLAKENSRVGGVA